ncbi:3'-5' exonuclease [Hymenobacter metallilatus]|uniref:3'-5' exonuclease n=1 Tax=Hymenobacter metallilatus TaxID=2493666 RepID=A0A428JMT0_9BACT|nr:exonuclease domain-containing protein [Hymenobacter metallilatus]RSK34577.1 3'-5' exonuclease [Hymenobacter metallilatus]
MPQQYLLFIDTETTGLPARWHRPYAEEWEWPNIAQLAWEIYTPAGQLLKAEQAYLQVPAGRLTKQSIAIHGLTAEFLAAQGQEPAAALRRLLADVELYRPRIIGHFLQLDFHVTGAALLRAGLPNPLPGLPQFCTMQVSRTVRPEAPGRPLRLHELHELLFAEPMERLHDAATDAAATARCFFELRRRGIISDAVLNGQPPLLPPNGRSARRFPWSWLLTLAGFLVLVYCLAHG